MDQMAQQAEPSHEFSETLAVTQAAHSEKHRPAECVGCCLVSHENRFEFIHLESVGEQRLQGKTLVGSTFTNVSTGMSMRHLCSKGATT